MIDLPFNAPDVIGGDTMLARYLRADLARVAVLETICGLLDEDGRVGDRARYFIVRNPFRRAVLRGTLIASAIPLPAWACDNAAAEDCNRDFMAQYRAAHNERQRSWNATIPHDHPVHHQPLFPASLCERPLTNKDILN